MRLPVLVSVCAFAGCVDAMSAAPVGDAHTQFTTGVWPALGACIGCHGAQPTIDFLAPSTMDGAYQTIFAFQPAIVNLEAPDASLLVTMGMHTGPALDPSSAMTIVAWLEAEQAERIPAAADPIRFGPVQPLLGGETAVDLGGGDTLTFTSATSGGGLYLSDLTITAGPGGLHVAHPLFVSHPTGALPLPDTVDRFGDVDAKLGPNKMLALGGGDALFLDFLPTDPLTIHFHTLEAP